jgi:hypothetical protein
MEDRLTMSNQDIDRLKVINNVLEHRLRWPQAADQLDLSARQVGYLCARVRAEGHKGILHRLRGKPSNNQLEPGLLDRALELLKEPRYQGFGPTFANEKLQKHYGIILSTPVLRLGMIREGLWRARKPKPTHRFWRERRSCVGELVQLDGSEHDWFEGRGPRCVLILYIDDATSRLLYAEFVDVEDTLTLLATTQAYLKRHGRPGAFYVDKDSIYKVNRNATLEEELQDSSPITQFTRAMADLGIGVICANSPQAKGRVERSFNTHQDRLVKELRLAGISDKKAANEFLWNVYLPAHNAQFAVPPANTTHAHRPLLKTHRLQEILSVRMPRVLANDYTLCCQKRFFQLLVDQPLRLRPKVTISVETRLDGSTHLRFKGRYLRFVEIPKRPLRPLALPKPQPRPLNLPLIPYKPTPRHPWMRGPSFGNPKNWNKHLVGGDRTLARV